MKFFKYLAISFIFLSAVISAQVTYSGPASGSVDTGVVRTTDDFTRSVYEPNLSFKLINHQKPEPIPAPLNKFAPAPPEGSNFILDPNYGKLTSADDSVIIFESFEGFRQSNSIPPDAYLAVGPEHIIFTVNSSFKITDKQGNELKSIGASQWYGTVLPGASPFDPKVLYDHYAKRWVMVWLDVNTTASKSHFLISVSDDDNPLGVWYNWAIPSNVNGSTPSGNWGDYQGVGFDDKAIYITSNQFSFASSFMYPKIRIIMKDQLYGNAAGPVSFTDIWNIKYPGTNVNAFGLRPTRMRTSADQYYLVSHSPYNVGTNFGIYTLSLGGAEPRLDGRLITVTGYSDPPDMDQLGGGTPRIDGGGFGLRNEPVYKNGKLYIVHAVRVTNNGAFSGVRYLEIDAAGNTVLADFVMGAPQYYHSYPAISVDGMNNAIITYSRSSKTGYAGAYFTIVPAGSQSPTGSFEMQPGKGNYVVTYGGARNRWGDYNGAWVDPVDTNSVWLYSEYVYQTNTWGTWASGVRFEPFAEPYIFPETRSVDLGSVELGGDTLFQRLIIRNFGAQALNISDVSVTRSDVFNLSFNSAFPASLNAFDTLIIDIEFYPTSAEEIFDSIKITSNDPDDPEVYIPLHAIGFEINAAAENQLYASTAPVNISGELLTLNESDASANVVGELGFPRIVNLAINPTNDFIYGLKKESAASKLVVVNALGGDAHLVAEYPIPISTFAFDTSGTLYGFTTDMNAYKLTLSGDTTWLFTLARLPSAVAFNPVDNQLWMFSRTGLNNGKLFKVNLADGSIEEIASVDLYPLDMTFDASGDLFAIYGSNGKLASIDTNTGVHFDVGSAGVLRVSGITIKGDVTVTSVNETIATDLPSDFSVEQNYPNPFNPATTINFSLPVSSSVTISLFNIIGQKVATIVNKEFSAGYHSVNFDASGLSSGTYIYKIRAEGVNGKAFISAKKMVLLK